MREKRGRREGRDRVAMPIYFFSGHKLVDMEKHTLDELLSCILKHKKVLTYDERQRKSCKS